MKILKYFIFPLLKHFFAAALVACVSFLSAAAQDNNLALGQWKIHLPFNKLNSVAEGHGVVYCAATDGLFLYEKDDGSISRLTRLEGLSDFNITHIRYNPAYHFLMIVYKNSNIDLVYDNKSIYNITDIERASIIGNKTINHIDFNGQYAYLSCGFGIVVVDVVKREVKDTWYIGPGGNSMPVYGTVFYNSEIFAATELGIFRANANNPNVFVYSAWQKDTTLPAPDERYNHLALWGSKLVANCDSLSNSNSLMVYDGLAWNYFDSNDHTVIKRLEYFNGLLILVNDWSIGAYLPSGNRTHYVDVNSLINSNQHGWPHDGFVDASDIMWIADESNGLVRSISYNENTSYYPNGPGSTSVYSMACSDSRVWVAAGMITGSGFFSQYSKEGGYLLKDNSWKTFSKWNTPGLDTLPFTDFVSVAVDPDSADHAFMGSWGLGLYEFTSNGLRAAYNATNSPLQSIPIPNSNQIQIGGLSFDTNGNLWIVDAAAPNPVVEKKRDGTWQTFSPPLLLNQIPQMIMCDSRNIKWIIMPWNNGLIAFDETKTFSHSSNEINDPHARQFTTTIGKGNLPTMNVQSIAEDHDGQIWVGTEEGVVVLYSPDNIYSGNYDFSRILLQQDGNWQYLLETEMVNAIAVDGANRKWFGTEGGGAFLMSPDGTSQVLHFTTENSPLLSNKIQTITIDQKSGEVYFGTDKGICSYKGDAIEGGEKFDNVYVYPNPVRPDYSGSIAIRGLVANANVKITDVSGSLVYETKANGGLAIWNGNNFQGQRAQSGVYLVYCSNDDGTKTAVTKLLFMH